MGFNFSNVATGYERKIRHFECCLEVGIIPCARSNKIEEAYIFQEKKYTDVRTFILPDIVRATN